MARQFRINPLAIAIAIAWAAILPSCAFAQGKARTNKKASNESQPAGESVSIARGLIVYQDRCAICHFSESDAQKIGPGLRGIYKREKFSNGAKVDDAAMENWILNGGKNMPPFKHVLSSSQVQDLIAYLKTLR